VGLIDILAQIDTEINQLKQARALLEGRRASPHSAHTPKKRNLTPEGRKRIAEAVKRRWALQKKNQIVEASAGWVNGNSPVSNLAYQISPM
jgi:hypothetical protein